MRIKHTEPPSTQSIPLIFTKSNSSAEAQQKGLHLTRSPLCTQRRRCSVWSIAQFCLWCQEWDSDPYVLAPNVTADLRIDEIVEGIKYPAFIGAPEKEGIIVANIFGPYDAR